MRGATTQRGVTLIVTLLMLVVIMLLALAAVNDGMVNLRIVDNMRTVQEREAAAQQAAEDVISTPDDFYNPKPDRTITINGMDVVVTEASCVWTQIVEGSSAAVEGTQEVAPPEDTYWEFDAYVVDGDGNRVGSRITQGVRMRMIANQCQ